MKAKQTWVVSQLGAREHYGVARALASQGALGALVTDAWAPPGSVWSRVAPRLAQRFHPDLAMVPVHAWPGRLLWFEAFARSRGFSGWDLMIARNHWFQRSAAAALNEIAPRFEHADKRGGGQVRPTLFSYSYAALHQFRWAKAAGWGTVLGQVDPGPLDNLAMRQLHARHAHDATVERATPSHYLDDWREECRLADRIVVNSEWSRQSLLNAGTPERKLVVIPLAFDVSKIEAESVQRGYPVHFDATRPLRILFLGNLSFRKGVLEIFDAIRRLNSAPCEFWFVGSRQIKVPADIEMRRNVKLVGPVARESVRDWYANSDVFILPTHSDGFGLTQLEALSKGLPVIASRNCGDVVKDGVNGLLLDKVSGQEIASKILYLLENPSVMRFMAKNCQIDPRFSISRVGDSLIAMQTFCDMNS